MAIHTGAHDTEPVQPRMPLASRGAAKGFFGRTPPFLRREDLEAQLSAAVDTYDDLLPRLVGSEQWADLLSQTATFPTLGFRNRVLVAVQLPHATRVGPPGYWSQRSRRIRQDALAAVVRRPKRRAGTADDPDAPSDGSIRGFGYLPLFDVADTLGGPIAPLVAPLARIASVPRRWQAVTAELRARGYRVEIGATRGPDTVTAQGVVRVSTALAPDARFHALLRVLCGTELGHTASRADLDPHRRSDEATASAFLLAHAFGAQASALRPVIGPWAGTGPDAASAVADLGREAVDANRRLVPALRAHAPTHR